MFITYIPYPLHPPIAIHDHIHMTISIHHHHPKHPAPSHTNIPPFQQGFIIATLISTIVGTFTTGIGLFDRLNDKRKQHKRDYNQDGKIAELEKRVDEAEKRSRSVGGGRGNGNGDGDGLRDSLTYGGPLVRREYDRGYDVLGKRFAEGDCEFLPFLSVLLTHG
jgi:hypothetical protein